MVRLQWNALLAAALYALLFVTTFVANRLSAIPVDQDGFDSNQAWLDLHQITHHPHPYNSHENDVVRDYLLSRLSPLMESYDYVNVHNDLHTNVTYADVSYATYFEGKNILIKIEGFDAAFRSQGGVLFSAHLDSVSTGVGATDDGMGVVTCIQLAHYFAQHRPRRTVIININDGEEDGLNGAHAFLAHPWSKIPETFVNMEGSGAGGRPVIFRATSASILSASISVPHPHANVLTSDAFLHGLIRSRTDYSVYQQGGQYEGFDLAFYKRRSRYHTKYDSIPFLDGGEKSLWAMMETARGLGRVLVGGVIGDDEFDEASKIKAENRSGAAVFFDLFSKFFIVFSQKTLLNTNLVVLMFLPIFLILALGVGIDDTAHLDGRKSSASSFWKSLGICFVAQLALTVLTHRLNPFIIYSSQYCLFATQTLLAYCIFQITLPIPDDSTAQRILGQVYIFTWFLTAASTFAVAYLHVGGLYFAVGWNVGVWLAIAIGMFWQMKTPSSQEPIHLKPAKKPKRVKSSAPPSQSARPPVVLVLQVVFSVAVPLTLIFPVTLLVLDGMTQSIADGSNSLFVHLAVTLCAFLTILPVLPWLPNQKQRSTYGTAPLQILPASALITLVIYVCFGFPFSGEDPFKVFFQQTVDVTPFLNLSTPAIGETPAVMSYTELTGVQPFLLQNVIPSLPSAFKKLEKNEVQCINTIGRKGTETCIWEDGLPPRFGPVSSNSQDKANLSVDRWLDARIEASGPQNARFWIRGHHSRNCRIYFDSARIVDFRVEGETQEETKNTPGFEMPSDGVDAIHLFSREWGREWVVDVEWKEALVSSEPRVRGRVACEWSEYAGGRSEGFGSVLPAYEDVVRFVPRWVGVSKLHHGLLEVWSSFEI